MKRTLNRHIQLCLLVSLSLILSYIQFPIIPIAPFLTLDVSVLPLLYAGIAFGMRDGILVILCKSAIFWLFQGANLFAGIGVITTVIADLVLLVGMLLLKDKSRARMVWVVTLILTLVMVIVNGSFIIPLYLNVLHLDLGMRLATYLVMAVVPFNLIKGVVTLLLMQALLKRLPVH